MKTQHWDYTLYLFIYTINYNNNMALGNQNVWLMQLHSCLLAVICVLPNT